MYTKTYYVEMYDKFISEYHTIQVYTDSNMYYLNVSNYLDTLSGFYDVKIDRYYYKHSEMPINGFNLNDTLTVYFISRQLGEFEENYRVVNKDNIIIFSGNQWRYRYLYMKEDVISGDTNTQYFNHHLDEIFNSFIFKMPPPILNEDK